MEFRILGPLEVRDDEGREIPLRGRRQRALLAILLRHANEGVSTDRLVHELWPEDRPPTALNALQVHISNLRKLIPGAVLSEPGGYRLAVGPDRLDAARFDRMIVDARIALAGGRLEEGSAELAEALSLWRGPALAEFRRAPFAEAEIARLEESRLTAFEDRLDAELALGRAADLVAELEGLVAENPLRERLRGQLMLALYRSGRQADALEEFQRARRALVGELGIEPSVGLKALQAGILRQDSALERGGSYVGPVGRSERRTVTIVCAAFAAGEERDPEATARATESRLEESERIVERYGGLLLEGSSDRMLALFGAPPSGEDHALRAVHAALELRDSLPVGAGVATGPVLMRPTEPGRPGVVGDVLGEAPRLAYSVSLGEILVDQTTRSLAGHALRLRKVGAARKPVWKLLEVTTGAPAIPRRQSNPIVGRTHELDQLLVAFERVVHERSPFLFTVLGPAGIGKSRLAAEFRRRVAATASVFAGRCLPYGDGITFWPLAEIVEQAVGERAPGALAERLGGDEQAGTIAERIAGALGAGGDIAGAEETFWAVRRFLEGLARTRPIVLLIEDLHWAEPTFLDLVDHVADVAQRSPILLVCLARTELLDKRPTWGEKSNAATMLLEPLSEDESAALVGQLARNGSLAPSNRSRIVDAAGGNPLFIEELVRVTVELGDAAETMPPLPPTIQAVLAARLDQLEPGERAVAEAASVVGREFWLEAVAELARDARLEDHLDALVRKDLVLQEGSSLTGEQSFCFRHLLIRDAAYEAIPKDRRAQLHQQFGDWLERFARDRLTEFQEIVGFHLEQAFRYRSELVEVDSSALDLAARASGHLAAAGLRAYAREDTPAQVTLLSRAIELLPAEDSRRLELLPELGEALREGGEFERAKGILDESQRLAEANDDAAVAAYTRVIQLLLRMRTDASFDGEEALADARRAVHVLERRGVDRWLAKGWELLAWIPYLGDRAPEAYAAANRMSEYARRTGDGRQEARALSLLLGIAVFGPLRVSEGIERCEEALRQHSQSQPITASATRALANLKAMNGDLEQARALLARDKLISADLGRPLAAARASFAYGMLELLADDAAAAEAELRVGYEALTGFGEKPALTNIASFLAEALYRQGRDDEALDVIEQARLAAAPEDPTAQAYWRGPLAKVLARQGRAEEAQELVAEALGFAAKTDSLSLRGDVLMDAAEVLRLNADVPGAAAHIRKAINAYDRKGNRAAARNARRALSELAEPAPV